MRIAVAQINPRVGDCAGNVAKMLEFAQKAQAQDAKLIVFGARPITGAPIDGLIDSHAFIEDVHSHLELFAKECPIRALLSSTSVVELDEDTLAVTDELFLVEKGKLSSLGAPALLESDVVPVVEVKDEDIAVLFNAHFEVGTDVENMRVLIEMSKDAFGDETAAPAARADLQRLSAVASDNAAFLIYVNLCGAADSRVFSGNSTITAPNGSLVHAAEIDEEDLFVFDTAPEAPTVVLGRPSVELEDCEIVWRALAQGTRDYVRKNGFTDVIVGLSGGIDSAVVATIATDALGAEHVHGVLMPGPYSSEHSLTDARRLASNLGISAVEVPIEPVLDSFHAILDEQCGGIVDGLAAENLQARVRTVNLMTIANTYGWLLLNTGNKSEAAMGFSTLYGDTAGAYAPIGDIYKTEVYELAEWRCKQGTCIPQNSIDKPASAELYPDAQDEDRLPPYKTLDAILEDHIENGMGADELVEAGHDAETVRFVLKTVQRNEYKRRCEPISPHVLGVALTSERAWPITNGWSDPGAK